MTDTINKLIEEIKDDKYNKDDIIRPIINDNNILHICASRGMLEELILIIKIYNKEKIDIGIKNNNGDNILHLLFKNGYDEIYIKITNTRKLISDTKNIYLLSDFNNMNETPLFYCLDRKIIFKLLDIYEKNNKMNIINIVNNNGYNIVTKLIDKTDNNNKYYDLITKITKHIDFSQPKTLPILMYSIFNNKTDISIYFIKHKLGINDKNTLRLLPINIACMSNNILIVKEILKVNDDIRTGGLDNTFLPINIAIKKNYLNLFYLLSHYIKRYDTIDKNGNIYLHNILDIMIKKNIRIDRNTLLQYINNSDLSKKNIYNITPKDLLIKLSKKYKIQKFIKSKYNKIKNNKIKNNKIKNNKIKNNKLLFKFNSFNKLKRTNKGSFNSDILHWMIYTYITLNKYNNISILTHKTKINKFSNINNKGLTYDIKIKYIIEFIETYFNKLSPDIIIWKNSKINYINKNFEKCLIKELNNKNRFILINLSLMLSLDVSHAELIIIDKKAKNITRFEPYGIDSFEDEYLLDKLIKKIVEKTTNSNYKYYIPRDYLDSVKYQSITRDNDESIKKLGDPIGYCLAWCIYFLELKLCNPDYDNEKLVKLGAEKINEIYKNKDNPYLYFIRDYASHLNEEKDKLLIKIGINKDDIYDLNYKLDNIKKIYNYIIKH